MTGKEGLAWLVIDGVVYNVTEFAGETSWWRESALEVGWTGRKRGIPTGRAFDGSEGSDASLPRWASRACTPRNTVSSNILEKLFERYI